MPKQFYKKRFSFGFVVASVILGLVVCILSTIAYGIKQGKDSAEKVAAARALPIYSVETDEKKLSISFPHLSLSDLATFAYPYPGKSTKKAVLSTLK